MAAIPTPDPMPAMLNNPATGASNQAKVDMVKRLLGFGGVAFLGGAGLRAAQGLREAFTPAVDYGAAQAPSYVSVPVPRRKAPGGALKEAAAAASYVVKTAGTVLPQGNPDWGSTVANAIGALAPAPGQADTRMLPNKILWPQGTTSMWDNPGAYVAAGLGGGGALWGGYKLVDHLLNRNRKRNQDVELESAKDRYHQSLLSQYGKQGSALDTLAEKVAFNWLAGVSGTGLAALGALGIGTGMATYNFLGENSQSKAVLDAVRRRREQLAAAAPRPILAVPEYVDEDDEAREKALKGRIPGFPAKRAAATPAEAASGTLAALAARRQYYQQQMAAQGEKPKAPPKPADPPPPRLPSVV